MSFFKKPRPVVLAVSSGGGHWVQMQRLAPAFSGAEVHYATTDKSASEQVGSARLHVFPDATLATGVFTRPQTEERAGSFGGFPNCVPVYHMKGCGG